MKKAFLIISGLILIASLNTHAQKGKELILGVGGGLTSVWIVNQNNYGEPELKYLPKMGYAASFNLGYNFDESMAIMTELQYSMQGQKYDGKQNIQGTTYNVDRDINLRYFNIPLFFKYGFGTSNTKFRFLVGPQFGILLEATQEYLRDGKKQGPLLINLDNEPFSPYKSDITDRYEKTEISLVLDVGADIHLSDQFFISAGARINYGLKDINVEAYRMNDLENNEYSPSHNFWGGLYVGVNYKLDVEGYSQRSF
ncbi:MAG: porin family protein [Bacteroidales bacterium]